MLAMGLLSSAIAAGLVYGYYEGNNGFMFELQSPGNTVTVRLGQSVSEPELSGAYALHNWEKTNDYGNKIPGSRNFTFLEWKTPFFKR